MFPIIVHDNDDGKSVPKCQHCGGEDPLGSEDDTWWDEDPVIELLCMVICTTTIAVTIILVSIIVTNWLDGDQPTLWASICNTGRFILHSLKTIW